MVSLSCSKLPVFQPHENFTCCFKINEHFIALMIVYPQFFFICSAEKQSNIIYVAYIFPIACIITQLMRRTCWFKCNLKYNFCQLKKFLRICHLFFVCVLDQVWCSQFTFDFSLSPIRYNYLSYNTYNNPALVRQASTTIMPPLYRCSKNYHPLTSSWVQPANIS